MCQWSVPLPTRITSNGKNTRMNSCMWNSAKTFKTTNETLQNNTCRAELGCMIREQAMRLRQKFILFYTQYNQEREEFFKNKNIIIPNFQNMRPWKMIRNISSQKCSRMPQDEGHKEDFIYMKRIYWLSFCLFFTIWGKKTVNMFIFVCNVYCKCSWSCYVIFVCCVILDCFGNLTVVVLPIK